MAKKEAEAAVAAVAGGGGEQKQKQTHLWYKFSCIHTTSNFT
jgi:hypothetical protein